MIASRRRFSAHTAASPRTRSPRRRRLVHGASVRRLCRRLAKPWNQDNHFCVRLSGMGPHSFWSESWDTSDLHFNEDFV